MADGAGVDGQGLHQEQYQHPSMGHHVTAMTGLSSPDGREDSRRTTGAPAVAGSSGSTGADWPLLLRPALAKQYTSQDSGIRITAVGLGQPHRYDWDGTRNTLTRVRPTFSTASPLFTPCNPPHRKQERPPGAALSLVMGMSDGDLRIVNLDENGNVSWHGRRRMDVPSLISPSVQECGADAESAQASTVLDAKSGAILSIVCGDLTGFGSVRLLDLSLVTPLTSTHMTMCESNTHDVHTHANPTLSPSAQDNIVVGDSLGAVTMFLGAQILS